MPVFEYRCQDCGQRYDILHIGSERREDVVCPSCQSTHHKKLLSVFNASTDAPANSPSAPAPACGNGACGVGGSCFN